MKSQIILLALAGLSLAGCNQQPTEEAIKAPKEAGPPPISGDPSKNPDMTGLAKEVDVDGNGQMSLAEWQGQGLPMSSFKMFEKGRGFVTLDDYQKNAAPAGIDLDGDGKLTIAEFKEFDKQMAAKMADGAAPPKGQ